MPGNLRNQSAYNKDTYILMFTVALFTKAKLYNQPRCSATNRKNYGQKKMLTCKEIKLKILGGGRAESQISLFLSYVVV